MEKLELEKKYEKSGQMGGAVGAVISLITGVGVAVLVLIFVGTLGGQTYQLVEPKIETISQDIVNASVTVLNSTAVTLGYNNVNEGTVSVLNSSNAVGLGNFTFTYGSPSTATLLNNNYNNTALDFSFTAGNSTMENAIKQGILSSFDALNQTADYLPIIVLAVIISLVLFLILGMGSMNGGRQSGSAL